VGLVRTNWYTSRGGLRSYTTAFATAPENPISEGGVWTHTPNPWAMLATTTSPNRAVSTQAGSGITDDSYAYLNGFGPNVAAQGTIYKDPSIVATNGGNEVELLFRMADSATTSRGYECNFSSNGSYAEIVRWNGAFNDYTKIVTGGAFAPAPVSGDIVRATIVGGTITTYIKRLSGGDFTQMAQITDNTFTDGQPGIGVWFNIIAGNSVADRPKFGFTNFTVTEI
jgi:hypothetical protein